MIIEARGNTAEVVQPCVKTFDLPAATTTAQYPAVPGQGFDSSRLMRRDHLDPLGLKGSIERVGVVSRVADQPSWLLTSEPRQKSVSDKGDFMRAGRRRVGGERKTIKSATMSFGPSPRLLAPTHRPFFFATMNVPSMKHYEGSRSPGVCKSSANTSSTRRRLPALTHCRNRQWRVWYGGKRPGKSFHLAPERSIQRMPFITSRFSLHGMLRPFSRLGSSGRCGSMTPTVRLLVLRLVPCSNRSTTIYETASKMYLRITG